MSAPSSARRWVFPILVSVLTFFCVFVLPFAFPPSHPAYGQSYVVGFNNRVAILCIAGISLGVFAMGWLGGVPPRRSDVTGEKRLRVRYLGWMCVATILSTTLLALLLLRSGAHSNEDGYFIPQMEKVLLSHRTIYSQVEFVYG